MIQKEFMIYQLKLKQIPEKNFRNLKNISSYIYKNCLNYFRLK